MRNEEPGFIGTGQDVSFINGFKDKTPLKGSLADLNVNFSDFFSFGFAGIKLRTFWGVDWDAEEHFVHRVEVVVCL